MPKSHFIIPDVQAKTGVDFKHLRAAGNYIVAHKPDIIICLGDFADMPSLSQYDKPGSKVTEGQRYSEDIKASHTAMRELLGPLKAYNKKRKVGKRKQYKPRMVMLMGNHDQARIERAVEANPRHLEGVYSIDDLGYEKYGWEVIPFLKIIEIDGILYSHYFINTDSAMKNVLSGTVQNRLKSIGQSFTQGHTQGLQIGIRDLVNGKRQRGLVAGSFYSHDEKYMGPQGNPHWRGCLMKNEVKNGDYCLMELSLDYLVENWYDR